MARPSYPYIDNCNYESRNDDTGRAIRNAVKLAQTGHINNEAALDALAQLEATLFDYADDGHADAVQACEAAERAVVLAFDEIRRRWQR